jgi:beta-lactam-binding protein with PASTA domain
LRLVRLFLYACLFGLGVVAGTYLLIRISFSGTTALVPPVTGLTQEQAEFQAKRAHLQFMVQSERYDLKAEKGRVISQTPTGGMTTRRGMTLAVVVSKGVERIQMPSLVGMRMDEAQIQVRQVGLRLSSTAYAHLQGPAQTIAAQDPPADVVVPKDSDVSILVSMGPSSPTFVSPYLIGSPLATVQAQLQSYGIQIGSIRTARIPGTPGGLVVSQNPQPGFPLTRSDVMQLTVGQP